MFGRKYFPSFFLILLAFLVWFFYWKLLLPPYLIFSDAAKFADSARNLVQGRGFTSNFSPFSSKIIFGEMPFISRVPSPLFPVILVFSFFIFGISDAAVIYTSGIFFIASTVMVYFLARRLFGELVAVLSALAFIFTLPMIDYAAIGASESIFIFGVLLIVHILLLKKKWSPIVGGLLTGLLFLTRPQAPIHFLGIGVFIWLSTKEKKDVYRWLIGIVIILLPTWLYGRLTSYSIFRVIPNFSTLLEHSPLAPTNITLRGRGLISPGVVLANLGQVSIKSFYHLYNFYKSLPTFISPYLMTLFMLNLVRWKKKKPEANAVKIMTLIILLLSFFAASLTIPFMRYIHPVAPLVIILGVEMLVWIVGKVVDECQIAVWKNLLVINRKSLAFIVSLFLLFVFVIGQTAGKIFLDSRFVRAHTNQGRSPVYVQLSWLLKENTGPNDLTVTNLDTWGSWYGERKTVWFPLEPNQLIPREGEELDVDAIYLTSYKIDDESYYMGEEWREILYSPEELEDPFFAENFELAEKFEVKAEETYEQEGAIAILLKRKE